jgi:signal transduction histidine kinase
MTPSSSRFSFDKLFISLGIGVVAVFSLAVFVGMYLVRTEVRDKMLQRDAALLQRVAQYLYYHTTEDALADWDIVELALDSSKIDGIIAVRVFRPLDTLIQQVPSNLFPVSLAGTDRTGLAKGAPIIRYFEAYPLDALFSGNNGIRSLPNEPLLEIVIPLLDTQEAPVAAIQYWIDGSSIQNEFAQLDQHLILWAAAFIGGGGSIFSVIFFAARKRLNSLADLLAQRNDALRKANRELTLAAKTSAIGAVASHLFHGLKNPLAGLKTYLKLTRGDAEAMEVADRMQGLIDETLAVIKNEDASPEDEIPLVEAVSYIRQKINPKNDPQIVFSLNGESLLSQRAVQLLQLILRNLVENALQAKQENNQIEISFQVIAGQCSVRVQDHGPGLPSTIKEHVFSPVTSAKTNGSGVGLAISAVLAKHLPGSIELLETSNSGTTFLIQIHS